MLAARFLVVLAIAAAAPVQLPRPVEIEANAIFRDAFVAVMEQEPGEWQLQPAQRRGTRDVPEEMTWRQRGNDKAFVRVLYWRYSSEDDARAALQLYRNVVSIATYEVKGFADEAFAPPGGAPWRFRRGSFVFQISAEDPVNLPPMTISLAGKPPTTVFQVSRTQSPLQGGSSTPQIGC